MGEFSLSHLVVIGIILLLLFGPSRLPNLGKSIGQAIKGFKQGLNEVEGEAKPVVDDPNRSNINTGNTTLSQGRSGDQPVGSAATQSEKDRTKV